MMTALWCLLLLLPDQSHFFPEVITQVQTDFSEILVSILFEPLLFLSFLSLFYLCLPHHLNSILSKKRPYFGQLCFFTASRMLRRHMQLSMSETAKPVENFYEFI